MRRHAKTKPISVRLPVRRTAVSAGPAARRNFPAWIDAGEATAPLAATRAAVPRVRNALVLRRVGSTKTRGGRGGHAGGAQ